MILLDSGRFPPLLTCLTVSKSVKRWAEQVLYTLKRL